MKRPLAYITAAWLGGDSENAELAAQYCRTVYEAGFSPICPPLYLPLFLNDAVPEEHKSGIFPYSICEQIHQKHFRLHASFFVATKNLYPRNPPFPLLKVNAHFSFYHV